jgi:hypothetical protein
MSMPLTGGSTAGSAYLRSSDYAMSRSKRRLLRRLGRPRQLGMPCLVAALVGLFDVAVVVGVLLGTGRLF